MRAQLGAIGDASRKCSTALAEELRSAIGSTDAGYVCEPGSEALICALGETRDSITQKAVDLSTVGTIVAGRFESDRLSELATAVGDVNSTVDELTDIASGLAEGDDSVEPLIVRLQTIFDLLTALQDSLQVTSSNGIPATIDAIHDRAQIAVGALGSANGSATVSQQAQAAAAAACALAPIVAPRTDEEPVPTTDGRDAVSVLLTGTTCSGASAEVPGPYGGRSVVERADTALESSTAIAGLSDLDDPNNPVAQQLEDFRGSISGLLGLVLGALNSSSSVIRGLVRELADELDALGSGIGTLAPGDSLDSCPTEATSPEDDLTALNRSFRLINCKQIGLDSFIESQFGDAGQVLDDVQGDLAGGQESADDARVAARDAVNDTTTKLSNRLDRAGDALRTRGAREIAAQRRRLDTEVGTVTRLLDSSITSAVKLIDSRVRTANGDLDESQQRLVGDLARVLTDIGSGDRDGSGLLGALADGASDTRLSNQSIVRVSNTASAFRNLRSAALEDIYLQQAQLDRSLQLQQELPVFGLTLPAGSRFVSVFSFHTGQS